MPISREEFESGQVDPTIYLMEILSTDILSAWSLKEVIAILQQGLGIDIQQNVVMPAFLALEAGGKIERKQISGNDYWILKMD